MTTLRTRRPVRIDCRLAGDWVRRPLRGRSLWRGVRAWLPRVG